MTLLRKTALVALVIGAAGSIALMLQAGRNSPRLLVVLFMMWVLSPFVVLAAAGLMTGILALPASAGPYGTTAVYQASGTPSPPANGDSPFAGRNLFNDITHVWAYTSIATRALLQMAGFGRVEFADESSAMIERHRWLKVPLMKCSQALLRFLIRAATRENIKYLSPSIYVAAWK